jgi:hypothetical protein
MGLVSDGQNVLRVGRVELPSRAYLAVFGFKGPTQQKLARLFSGGERNRLNLALTLKQGGNLLLLDEPTNDLDVETLASMEQALLNFPGSVVVTAHDRWFLDRVATQILAWEGTDGDPGSWFWFEGNFAGYEKNKIERLGPAAARPHRVTYRRRTRDWTNRDRRQRMPTRYCWRCYAKQAPDSPASRGRCRRCGEPVDAPADTTFLDNSSGPSTLRSSSGGSWPPAPSENEPNRQP